MNNQGKSDFAKSFAKLDPKSKIWIMVILILLVIGIIALTLWIAFSFMKKEIKPQEDNVGYVQTGAPVQSKKDKPTVTVGKLEIPVLNKEERNLFQNSTLFEPEINKIDFKQGLSYQFSPLEKGEPFMEIQVKGYKPIVIRLFNLSPEYRKMIELMKQNLNGSTGNILWAITFADLNIANVNKPALFPWNGTNIPKSLVPYKGALTITPIYDNNQKVIGGNLSIVDSDLSEDDQDYLRNFGFPNQLAEYAKEIGARFFSKYMDVMVIGQVQDMSVIDKINADIPKFTNDQGQTVFPPIEKITVFDSFK